MPRRIGIVRASLKYQDKDGKTRSQPRRVGDLMEHSDGSRYIECDGYFDWGKLSGNSGSMFFLSIIHPTEDEQ